MRTNKEWLLDPDLSNKGMKCTFDGEHKATRTSSNELTHQMLFGRGRNRKLKSNEISVFQCKNKRAGYPDFV